MARTPQTAVAPRVSPGQTASLEVLEGGTEVAYIDHWQGLSPRHEGDVGIGLGTRLPVQRDLITELRLTKRGPRRSSPRRLCAELERIVSGGVAVVAHNSNPCASASLGRWRIPMISLEELVEHLAPHLITTADRISARLGYRRADEQVNGR